MCDFAPGDLVVCVDAKPRVNSGPLVRRGWLRQGGHYRVSAVLRGLVSGLMLVRLADAPPATDGLGFYADRFRKLNDGDDDAALIQRIKDCRPVREREPA